MDQMTFDKEAATRRFQAIGKKMGTMVKEQVKKPSVLKKLDAYKEAGGVYGRI